MINSNSGSDVINRLAKVEETSMAVRTIMEQRYDMPPEQLLPLLQQQIATMATETIALAKIVAGLCSPKP